MNKLMPKQECINRWTRWLLIVLLWFYQSTTPLKAEPAPLHLEVFINGHSTQLIAAFTRHEDGRFSSTASELKELGLKTNNAAIIKETVFLEDIAGLSYQYRENTQTLYVNTSKINRLAKNYMVGKEQNRQNVGKSDFGAVLNYSINGTGNSGFDPTKAQFEGVSALLNIRSFGSYGAASSSFVITSDQSEPNAVTRLETRWRYSDEERLITYTIGDIISGGPSWARPTRLGGIKINRNFSIRPDLITQPVANVSGSAALPSTVDVYIRNVKTHSQKVSPGPFTLSNIPAITGNGTARIVVRDAIGHETVTYSDFFLSPQLLAAGYLDFSVEFGVARGNFGERSFDYSKTPYLSGSFRYGWQDTATLDGHLEAGSNLALIGGGITFPVANKALFNFSGASSFHKNTRGFLAAASLETTLFGLSINARSQRSFGDFKDIATVTADDFADLPVNSGAILSAAAFPKALDQISVGIPFVDWGASLNASFIHSQSASSKANSIVSVSLSKKLFGDSSFYATAFADTNNIKSPSIFAGLSIPLGKLGSLSTGGNYNQAQGWRASTSYAKPIKNEAGSLGWRIQDQEGKTSVRNAAVSYRASAATIEARVSQAGKALEYSAYAQGAIVMTRSGVFPANRIDDSFAIVDVGASDVPVLYENRLMGITDSSGKFLIPTLNSYSKNKISIDPTQLPINANLPTTSKVVIPPYQSGVTVKFDVSEQSSSAVVIVKDQNGKALAAGTKGLLGQGQNEVIAGFDGRVFVENLASTNQIIFQTKSGPCRIEFEFKTATNIQVEIGPLTCK